jgi:hypothetical protein
MQFRQGTWRKSRSVFEGGDAERTKSRAVTQGLHVLLLPSFGYNANQATVALSIVAVQFIQANVLT